MRSVQMTKYLAASILIVGLAGSAFAAAQAGTQHFAVKDTVGNCAVVDTLPSKVSGLRIVGNEQGYGSVSDAQKALGSDCVSKIDRA
jgi:hypothetical protein